MTELADYQDRSSASKWWGVKEEGSNNRFRTPLSSISPGSDKPKKALSLGSRLVRQLLPPSSQGSSTRLQSPESTHSHQARTPERDNYNPLEELFGGSTPYTPEPSAARTSSHDKRPSIDTLRSFQSHPLQKSSRTHHGLATPHSLGRGSAGERSARSPPGSANSRLSRIVGKNPLGVSESTVAKPSVIECLELECRELAESLSRGQSLGTPVKLAPHYSGPREDDEDEFGGVSAGDAVKHALLVNDASEDEFGGIMIEEKPAQENAGSSTNVSANTTSRQPELLAGFQPVLSQPKQCMFCRSDHSENTLVLKCKHYAHTQCLQQMTRQAIQNGMATTAGAASGINFAKCRICQADCHPIDPAEFAELLELYAKQLRAPPTPTHSRDASSVSPTEAQACGISQTSTSPSIYSHYANMPASVHNATMTLAKANKIASAPGLEMFFVAIQPLVHSLLDEATPNYTGDNVELSFDTIQEASLTITEDTSTLRTPMSACSGKDAFARYENELAIYASESRTEVELECVLGISCPKSSLYRNTESESDHLRDRTALLASLRIGEQPIPIAEFGNLRLESVLNISRDSSSWVTSSCFLFDSGLVVCRRVGKSVKAIACINLNENLVDVRVLKRGNASALRLGLRQSKAFYLTGNLSTLQNWQLALSDPCLQFPVDALQKSLRLEQPSLIDITMRKSLCLCLCVTTPATNSESNILLETITSIRNNTLSLCDQLTVVISGGAAPPSLIPLAPARDPDWEAKLRTTFHQRMGMAVSIGDGKQDDTELETTLAGVDELLADRRPGHRAAVVLITTNPNLKSTKVPTGLLTSKIPISTIAVVPFGSETVEALMPVAAHSGGRFLRQGGLVEAQHSMLDIIDRCCRQRFCETEISISCADGVTVQRLLAADRAPTASLTAAAILADPELASIVHERRFARAEYDERNEDLGAEADSEFSHEMGKDFQAFEFAEPGDSRYDSRPHSSFMPGVQIHNKKNLSVSLGMLAAGESASVVVRIKVPAGTKAGDAQRLLSISASTKRSISDQMQSVTATVSGANISEAKPETTQRILLAEMIAVLELLQKHVLARRLAASIKLIRKVRTRFTHISEMFDSIEAKCDDNEYCSLVSLVRSLDTHLGHFLDCLQSKLSTNETSRAEAIELSKEALWYLRSEQSFEVQQLASLCV